MDNSNTILGHNIYNDGLDHGYNFNFKFLHRLLHDLMDAKKEGGVDSYDYKVLLLRASQLLVDTSPLPFTLTETDHYNFGEHKEDVANVRAILQAMSQIPDMQLNNGVYFLTVLHAADRPSASGLDTPHFVNEYLMNTPKPATTYLNDERYRTEDDDSKHKETPIDFPFNRIEAEKTQDKQISWDQPMQPMEYHNRKTPKKPPIQKSIPTGIPDCPAVQVYNNPSAKCWKFDYNKGK